MHVSQAIEDKIFVYPDGVDLWKKEGLFIRDRKYGYNFTVNIKANYVKKLNMQLYDTWSPSSYGKGIFISPQIVNAERWAYVESKFKPVSDYKTRELIKLLVMRKEYISLKDFCKKYDLYFADFVRDFNIGLQEMRIGK